MPHHKTLDEYAFSFRPDPGPRKVKDLATFSFVEAKAKRRSCVHPLSPVRARSDDLVAGRRGSSIDATWSARTDALGSRWGGGASAAGEFASEVEVLAVGLFGVTRLLSARSRSTVHHTRVSGFQPALTAVPPAPACGSMRVPKSTDEFRRLGRSTPSYTIEPRTGDPP
ncbi:ATP-binding protein [Streptomyces sp. NBC_01594]